MKSPLVSVVMPVYNAGRFLGAALDSILAQTFIDFELIAVDDGSTDGSSDILAEAAGRDPRVVVRRQQNGGVTKALNAGLQVARGTFIARMDADDIALPDRFERQVAYLMAHPTCVAVGGQVILMDQDDRALCRLPVPCDHAAIDRFHMEACVSAVCHPTAIIRTSAIRDIGGYRDTYTSAEDVDLFLRLAEVGSLVNLEEVVLRYRQHTESIGYKKRFEQRHSGWRAARDAAARRGQIFTLPEPRQTEAEVQLSDIFLKWAWWAHSEGNMTTFWHYARRFVFAKPFSQQTLRLLYAGIKSNFVEPG
ncbi:glycosyltransferase [Erythrobacter sp. sf7]|uniref:Glycosyltransferase n=1 Tax=Erythrobacter fulvus TaxID=2987523 RepID=A0ABT5JLG7_9SPHN|nr:glycosyltransferase [Erythrobacter fulvus]MDC8753601.1 glycosyltransferase [Erythrobacter fulvus]